MLTTLPRDCRTGILKFPRLRKDHSHVMRIYCDCCNRGARGTAMVPQNHLSEAEQHAVIAYLKTFSPRWRQEKPVTPLSIPPPPSLSVALRQQGQQLYQQTGCVACHGAAGHGDGPLANNLRDTWGAPIQPANLRQCP